MTPYKIKDSTCAMINRRWADSIPGAIISEVNVLKEMIEKFGKNWPQEKAVVNVINRNDIGCCLQQRGRNGILEMERALIGIQIEFSSKIAVGWLSEKHETCTFLEDFNVATTRIAEAAKNKETANHLPEVKKCIADLKTFLKSFDQELKSSATFVFWRQYMDIVQILLQFISAEREGLWQLHLSSFARMLPWMAVYDHINYLRWGTVYLSDMYQLATTAPVVFDEFEKGNFVMKESDGKFNQVSADLALEHVTRLAEDTRTMFGIQPSRPSTTKAEPEHKESGKKRMEKDEADVLHLVNQFTRFKVFDRNESERICISTNDVAPPDVAKDLLHAESNGKKVVETFINER
ncbi:hypothetical protein GQR58_013093 [Nymphon striatum]|nr:hypothetical protein GQR58_013093 [Nymphon striatum]